MGTVERDVDAAGFRLRLRDAGAPDGRPVLHFHGTPSSRLELAWADEIAADEGIRLITFDRPGYGGSPPARFGLLDIAQAAVEVADTLGIQRFWTLGQSGGGPFALATAYVAADRVGAAGSASGAAPFVLVPGSEEDMWEADREGLALLPTDPAAAVKSISDGLDLADALENETSLLEGFRSALSPADSKLLEDPLFASAFYATIVEGLRVGKDGYAWDNLAYLPAWEFEVSALGCPVYLWYGDEDLMVKPAHGQWLRENIPTARLTLRSGTGHLGIFTHLAEMLAELTG